MSRRLRSLAVVGAGCLFALVAHAAQGPADVVLRAQGRGARGARPSPPDPAVLERARGLYAINCAFCHGSEARGGETGPNLLRSAIVLDDQDGDHLLPFLRVGRPDKGMPARPDLTERQIKDIALLLRTLRTTGRDPGRHRPATIVVGDPVAGRQYFAATCAKCHSTTGDLQGLATRYPDPRALQQTWLSGTAAGGRGRATGPTTPTMATVTLPSGERMRGKLARLDDFIVSLQLADGSTRTFVRRGDDPPVAVDDPLQAHRELVPTYQDRDIHNLTAYLVTLK
jgi:mono/diheme cytochrome c family protein